MGLTRQNCKTEPLSTGNLAKANNQLAQVIKVMSFDVALAHKIAAWIERGLMRDIYDIYFFVSVLNIQPDKATLESRLRKISYLKKTTKNQPRKMSIAELQQKIKSQAETLNQKEVDEGLKGILKPIERVGLDKKIKIALNKLIEIII